MSELTICVSCGGRTYEHAQGCKAVATVAAALQDLEFNCWPGGIANDCDHERDAARLIEWLAYKGQCIAESGL